MRIAIAGAGITGAFLFHLLSGKGHRIDLYDLKNGTSCGMTPCAWGTSMEFIELGEAAGLDPRKYILGRFDHVIMDGVKIPANLMTIDKPRFLSDLLAGEEIRYTTLEISEYDRLIDATGVSRAFLAGIEDDIILKCMQCRVQGKKIEENRIKLTPSGYAWCFPLSQKGVHIGCGSVIADAHEILQQLGWIEEGLSEGSGNIRCQCDGAIRLTSPHYSQPFYDDNAPCDIWGVGEAIGCVAPLAGDGIVPGMKSVQILCENWDDPDGYREAILEEFHWMKSERKIVDKLRQGKPIEIADALVLKKNAKRMGMRVGWKQAVTLLGHLR